LAGYAYVLQDQISVLNVRLLDMTWL